MKNVFISWSGGKDSCYACLLAQQSGLNVTHFMNMMNEDGRWSFVHRFPSSVLEQQAEAAGVKLLRTPAGADTYADDYTKAIEKMKADGIEGGVFGDIDLEGHREWVVNICKRSGIEAFLPAWGMAQDTALTNIIESGIEAVIVACNEKYFGEEWLGRKIDSSFYAHLKEMQKTSDITTCGETGEYHTLVVNAPLFSRRISIETAEHRFHNGYWFLEIQKSTLVDK
ncbi:MAG: diphthine--ammonia ligase [Dehalococcoidales bacterium]|nr:diphthine--ammonia ligase [Dehalococcoidales bacterium]